MQVVRTARLHVSVDLEQCLGQTNSALLKNNGDPIICWMIHLDISQTIFGYRRIAGECEVAHHLKVRPNIHMVQCFLLVLGLVVCVREGGASTPSHKLEC